MRRLDESLRVGRVFLDPGCDRKDVGVEDDVLGREVHLVHEQPVRAGADLDLALDGVGLADFVKRHHHHGRAVLAHVPRLLDECLLARFEADRVADALSLQAFEPGFED